MGSYLQGGGRRASRASARYSGAEPPTAAAVAEEEEGKSSPPAAAATPYGAAGPPGQRVQATTVAGRSGRMRAATMAAADAAKQIDLATTGSGVRARAALFEQQQEEPPPQPQPAAAKAARSVRLQDVMPAMDVEGAGTRSVRAASSESLGSAADSPRKRATTLTSTPL